MVGLRVERLTGGAIAAALDDVAKLRIEVFREWPYLYAGTLAYERWYLAELARSTEAVVIVARAGGAIVGAATATPLVAQHAELTAPFRARGLDLQPLFYFAESVLRPAYRRQGIGHAFFDEREAHARALGYAAATFCAVIRPADHPLKPAGYRPVEPLWRQRGYVPIPDMVAHFPWREAGSDRETTKPLQYWWRRLAS